MAVNTHELAWAAGFYEGEGCIYAMKHRRIYRPAIHVSQSSDNGMPYVLIRFQSAVGNIGSLYSRPIGYNNAYNKTPMYMFWTTKYDEVQLVINLLWPFLGVVKRGQIRRVYDRLDLDIPGEPTRYEQHCKKMEALDLLETR